MKWPWDRWREAEAEAVRAEARLDEARREHAEVRKLAEETRRIKQSNGFAEAVRAAFGVHR